MLQRFNSVKNMLAAVVVFILHPHKPGMATLNRTHRLKCVKGEVYL